MLCFNPLDEGASSKKFMRLGAYADRILALERAVRELSEASSADATAAAGTIERCEDAIAFESAVVVTPSNATLVRDLNLRVPAGTNLLVTGPNGAGARQLAAAASNH
jgi:ABC-type uncharacterized transport system fused permease/ATPase subunit